MIFLGQMAIVRAAGGTPIGVATNDNHSLFVSFLWIEFGRRWWEQACSNQFFTLFYAVEVIDAQDVDRRSTDRGFSDENAPLPSEMLSPNIHAGIEKGKGG